MTAPTFGFVSTVPDPISEPGEHTGRRRHRRRRGRQEQAERDGYDCAQRAGAQALAAGWGLQRHRRVHPPNSGVRSQRAIVPSYASAARRMFNISVVAVAGGEFFVTRAVGPGRVAFSRDSPGHSSWASSAPSTATRSD